MGECRAEALSRYTVLGEGEWNGAVVEWSESAAPPSRITQKPYPFSLLIISIAFDKSSLIT